MSGKRSNLGEVVRRGGVLIEEMCVHIFYIQGRLHIAAFPPPTYTPTLCVCVCVWVGRGRAGEGNRGQKQHYNKYNNKPLWRK